MLSLHGIRAVYRLWSHSITVVYDSALVIIAETWVIAGV
jgi:hypothetical protein